MQASSTPSLFLPRPNFRLRKRRKMLRTWENPGKTLARLRQRAIYSLFYPHFAYNFSRAIRTFFSGAIFKLGEAFLTTYYVNISLRRRE